ncbi:universal stress protein [Duganella violaceipulchra]|uniref:Nucleotide-binding universal stress UspA family protein n=1 Tax=Duganella violaceipulchra TaxID=2849652 RepID=A0AA41L6I5_9BURK|nr:universal stress protein [Duganella violaceicalia]MBV6323337.1 universal stress protein [Duganella violaceicalia]MCP2007712.1 nucleotide-binding universal stress UspA family protein [Duganella violaceicalia]
MSYKTILVHADGSPQAAQRIRLAAQLALAHDAHLVGAAMTGLSRHALPDGSIAPLGAPFPFDQRLLHSRADAALTQFADCASRMGLHSFEARLVDDAVDDGLILQSPYADLLVLGQGDPQGLPDELLNRLPRDVLFQSARALLIVPHNGQFDQVGQQVLVGWDGSVAAIRALSAALPALRRAARVTLVPSPSPDGHGRQADLPGAELARNLARHGIHVTLARLDGGRHAGAALLELASDVNADLLVMGGYGHWRLREWMLGGATRGVLHDMTLPVLMAH